MYRLQNLERKELQKEEMPSVSEVSCPHINIMTCSFCWLCSPPAAPEDSSEDQGEYAVCKNYPPPRRRERSATFSWVWAPPGREQVRQCGDDTMIYHTQLCWPGFGRGTIDLYCFQFFWSKQVPVSPFRCIKILSLRTFTLCLWHGSFHILLQTAPRLT